MSPCLALLKPCPYTEHFESKTDGEAYVKEWEDNIIKHPKLTNEKILEPKYNNILNANEFKDKSLFKGLYITEDSFAIVMDKNNLETGDMSERISNNIKEGYISGPHIMQAYSFLEKLETVSDEDKKEYRLISEAILKRYYKNRNVKKYKESLNELLTNHPKIFSMYHELNKQYDNETVLLFYGYNSTDILVDKNTFLRVYSKSLEGLG